MLRVRVLGELALEEDGQALEPPASRRARSLLGFLAVDRRSHSRAQLSAKFWPDVLDESARTSLRSALSAVRKSVGSNADRYLIADRERVALADEVWVDLTEFEQLMSSGRAEEALALCDGELLQGLDDDWIYERRDEHRDDVANVLAHLAAEAEERGELERSIRLSRRQVALDPLAEEAQRELIRRLAHSGDSAAALTAYRRLQDRLRSELGIVPSLRTRELVQSLRGATEQTGPPGTSSQTNVPSATRSRPTGTVALLFTDQASSTEILQRLGDDEAERRRRLHFRLLREVAQSHGGEEVKNLGDGLMVVFASSVDAVACAIGIQQAVHRTAVSEHTDPLAVRVGLNVGEPIVDEDDYFGTPVVMAKRLCDAASPGQILAADVVRSLVGNRGGFEFKRVGPVALKGIADPVSACEIAWEPTTELHIPLPAAVEGVEGGAFIGRVEPREELQRRWKTVLEGQRHVLLLAGEPGIGKTRLAAVFCRAVHAEGAAVLAGRCYEERVVPYQPFREALRNYISGCPLVELTVQVAPRRQELARLVPELEEGAGRPSTREGQAEQERVRLFEAVADLLADAALARPTVLLLDDLQWADEASLLLLRHAVRATEGSRLLVLGTYRKTELEERSELAQALAELRRARALEELELAGLAEAEVAELVAAHADDEVPVSFARQVAEHTAGNPFFIEELLRHVEPDERFATEALDVPASVKDLLRRRLDRLEDDSRNALMVAAVAGRRFELEVLKRVLDLSESQLVEVLERAVHNQVLVEEPGAIGNYRFAHPLIRETIYAELSSTRAGLMHRRLAETLESLHADHLEEHAGLLAYHYRAAGDPGKAFQYHRQAADVAERATALETAFEHLSGAIAAGELLGLTANSDPVIRELYWRRAWAARFVDQDELAERDNVVALEGARAAGDRELEMHVLNAMGMQWHVFDSDKAIRFHEQSLRLAEELEHELGQVRALNRLSLVHANQLDFTLAQTLADKALAIARRCGDEDAAMRAMDSLKFIAVQLGDLDRLEELTTQLEAIQRQRKETWFLLWTLFEGSFVPMGRGRWNHAAAKLDEAVAITERCGDYQSGSLMLHGRCWLERLRGHYGRAIAAGKDSVALAERSQPVWLGWASGPIALTLRDLYAFEEARERLERGLAAADRIGARGQVLSCLGDLAWLRWLTGEEAAALETVTQLESALDEVRSPPGRTYLYTTSTYTSAARTALAASEPARAEALIGRYLEAAQRAGIGYAVAEGKFLLAQCARARRAGDEDELLASALSAAGTDGLPALRREIHGARAAGADARGDPDAFNTHIQAAKECIEEIVSSLDDEELLRRFRTGALAELGLVETP